MEKLKQRVASSSSRVIASLQAAKGSFQSQQQQQQQQQAQAPHSSSARQPSESATASEQQQHQHQSASSARFIAANAAAHLTDEEREILLQVFKKEEQFQRDTIK